VYDQAPQGYPYTFDDIERAISHAFTVSEWAKPKLDVDDVLHVYSGQGMHVYLLDEDLWRLTKQSREAIKDIVRESERIQIPVDPVVTQSIDRLLRVPYSLHAGVSRICQPIQSASFDPRTQRLPDFLEPEEQAVSPVATQEAIM
jgi:DNA primase catalytic subunit